MCIFLFQSRQLIILCIFFFNDTATTEIYTLSLHDALPICEDVGLTDKVSRSKQPRAGRTVVPIRWGKEPRSEEHTSELQSHSDLVCRLLLEKKKKKKQSRRPLNSVLR